MEAPIELISGNPLDWPPIFKLNKNGSVQTYRVYVVQEKIIVKQGQSGGEMQYYETICESKNVGRSNETTPAQQAMLEAQAKHDKKLKSGYTLNISGETNLQLPMKIKVYQDFQDKIVFEDGVYLSPKLDGVNGEYRVRELDVDQEIVLLSRGGNDYPSLDHLEPSIVGALNHLGTTRVNGELYIHNEHLQDITGAVKKYKEHITPRLKFYAFDLPVYDTTYIERMKLLDQSWLDVIPYHKVESHEEIEQWYDYYTERGFEGVVLKMADAPYEYNTRSSKMWKYKKAQSAEFHILYYEIDKNGHPVFTCQSNHNIKTFKVKPKGTNEERLAILENITDYIGYWYTVEFETLSKDNIPLKPVGIGLRACDENGQPIE